MNIGKTIFSQIKMMDPTALMAWGAKDLIDMGDGLKFKTSGLVKKKCYVYIKYDEGQDLYNVIFGRVRKSEWIVDKKVENVFVDMLIETIDEYVG